MYVFAIADKNTGEILHCLTTEDDGAGLEKRIKEEGVFPITLDQGWDDSKYFYTSLLPKDLPTDAVPGAKKFREEYKIYPSGTTGKGMVSKCRLERRAVKGKINEVDGTIVDDPSKYAEVIAESRRKQIE